MSAFMDESDEDTKRWFTDPSLLSSERRQAESERSALRLRPETDVRVEVSHVRDLYHLFLRVMGPAAKLVFESELRALGLRPSTMTLRQYAALAERLAVRIPVVSSRERFVREALVQPNDTWP